MCVVCQYVGWGSCSERYRTLGFLGIISLIFFILAVFFSRRVPSGPADREAPVGFADDGMYYGIYYGQVARKYAKLKPICKAPFVRDWRLVFKWLAATIFLAITMICVELFWFQLLDGILVCIIISSAFMIELAQLARRVLRRI
ncbi:hypothetical protein BSKO_01814 [Bryopsis sp. KO-2023]|nr:hypothetical protein BSKO_01814 [Bryopsis sp. KO-2023]